ncbi:MAG: hypothetical protein IPJ30_25675 [Acidobacteria bacterium]|nr:hypothetical protein [Acidobacteriota bacterium]
MSPLTQSGDNFASLRDGIWYVLFSCNNFCTTKDFGIGTDIPIPFSKVTL